MEDRQGFITVGLDYGNGEGQAHMVEIDPLACEAMLHLFRTDYDWMLRKVCELAGTAFVHERKAASLEVGGVGGAAQQPAARQH